MSDWDPLPRLRWLTWKGRSLVLHSSYCVGLSGHQLGARRHCEQRRSGSTAQNAPNLSFCRQYHDLRSCEKKKRKKKKKKKKVNGQQQDSTEEVPPGTLIRHQLSKSSFGQFDDRWRATWTWGGLLVSVTCQAIIHRPPLISTINRESMNIRGGKAYSLAVGNLRDFVAVGALPWVPYLGCLITRPRSKLTSLSITPGLGGWASWLGVDGLSRLTTVR
jgi:hypothetical protein